MTKVITTGKLRSIDGYNTWGLRTIKRINRRKKNLLSTEQKSMKIFIYITATTTYTCWLTDESNHDALEIDTNLMTCCFSDYCAPLTVAQRCRKRLSKMDFVTTEWFFVDPNTDIVTRIHLPKNMAKQMAKYLKTKKLFDMFCCYDFVHFLNGKESRDEARCTFVANVDETRAKQGDVVIYMDEHEEIVHVGIYLGHGLVVSKTGTVDNILVNTLEDMKTFYEFYNNGKKLSVATGQLLYQ